MSEYDTLEQESAILAHFETLKNPNAKKVKKLAAKLYAEVPHEIQKRLCRDVYRAHDPLTYVRSCIEKIRDCSILIEQFIEDGCHGMIFTGKDGTTVYPVTLKTLPHWLSETERWDPEQEALIQHDAVNAWMKEHDKGYFYGKVVLFPKFGFSGEPRIIEMQCSDDTAGLHRYPGTNYFTRDKPKDIQEVFDRTMASLERVVREGEAKRKQA
jgi:hypothetical protein